MNLSTFRDFQKQHEEYTNERTGQHPHDVIYVFVDEQLAVHIHQDNGTPKLYRALRDKKKLFIGGAAFTKTLIGTKLIDRITPQWCGLPEEFREQASALLFAAAKSWLKIPIGAPEGKVPCHINWKEDSKTGMHVL